MAQEISTQTNYAMQQPGSMLFGSKSKDRYVSIASALDKARVASEVTRTPKNALSVTPGRLQQGLML